MIQYSWNKRRKNCIQAHLQNFIKQIACNYNERRLHTFKAIHDINLMRLKMFAVVGNLKNSEMVLLNASLEKI